MSSRRIVSGMRPTGKLHLGHFHGVLANWLELQKEYNCFFFAADWHSLTTEYADTAGIRESIHDMVLDWLAFGIDPEKSTIFCQSAVHQHAELNLILSMITPVSWLERNPTYKEMQDNLAAKDLSTFGFLGYPVLMAADIILYRATRVPVGHDQLPHLEITREITRRFNYLYGEVFPEPDGSADRESQGSRPGRQEDEQVIRQCHLSLRDCRRDQKKSNVNGDRYPAGPAHRCRGTGQLCRLVAESAVSAGLAAGGDLCRLPDGSNRLCGLQEGAGPGSD